MAGAKKGATAPKAAKSKGSAANASDEAAAAASNAAKPAVDLEKAAAAPTEGHQVIKPAKLEGLPPVPDEVSRVIGPVAKAVPVKEGKPARYRLTQRSFMPRRPGEVSQLIEAGEEVVFAGKPGGHMTLLGEYTPPAPPPEAEA